MSRKKKVPTLAEFGLTADQINQIQDLREGFLGAPEHRVIAHAVESYLENRGINAEPEVKRRYDDAKQRRLATKK
jgi:hypothetical protein